MDNLDEVVIRPRRGVVGLDIRAVWRYRDLIWMFVIRDYTAFYKQTILGPLWHVIQPVVTSMIFAVIFGGIANIPTSGAPPFAFYFAGVILWSYLSACFTSSSDVFSKNAAIFSKVYFPRMVIPIAAAISSSLSTLIQAAVLAIIFIFYSVAFEYQPSWVGFLVLPLCILFCAVVGISAGLIASSLTVRYKDLAVASAFIVQIWMYATPVVYPLEQVAADWRWIFGFNPMTTPIELFRAASFGSTGLTEMIVAMNLCICAVWIAVGILMFSRAETVAMDTV